MKKATRKSSPPIKVYCLPEERALIETQARRAGTSMSTYLLNVGMGYPLSGVLDNKRVEELARINGDLGRLGGLLKLWLTDDPRTAEFGEATIRAILAKIVDTRDKMHEVMRAVVLPRGPRQTTDSPT
jgi:hypothetical protein